jgi:hypothetical protein
VVHLGRFCLDVCKSRKVVVLFRDMNMLYRSRKSIKNFKEGSDEEMLG